MRTALAPLLVCALLALAACARQPAKGEPLPPGESFKHFSGTFENSPDMGRNPPRVVAVLPFAGDPKQWSSSPLEFDPRDVVRRSFYNHFASLPFVDLELAEVDQRLRAAGLGDPAALAKALAQEPQRLKAILGADAVVSAEITHYDRVFLALATVVSVGCEVRMTSLASGEMLWRATHVSRGLGGGLSDSPISLAVNFLAAAWKLRHEELYSKTDDLFREMVATIARPEHAPARPDTPAIDLFAVLRPERPLRRGEELILRLVGDPGATAYASLGGFRPHLPLAPLSPASARALRGDILRQASAAAAAAGRPLDSASLAAVDRELSGRAVYEGRYLLEPDVEERGLSVTGYLVSASGGQALRLDPGAPLDLDSRPPAAPEQPLAAPLDGRLRLSWKASPAPDLERYLVERSEDGLGGFAKVAESAAPEAMVAGLPNFVPFFYRVRAQDRSGNLGEPSPLARAAALPDPALAAAPSPGPGLEGTLAGVGVLRADKSPFLVRGELLIPKGAALHIEPGAILRFAPGAGITVRGGELAAHGTARLPVRFIPELAGAPAGAWAGLTVEAGGRMSLAHAEIQRAEVGLSITQAAPALHAVRVLESGQAGLHLHEGARPVVTCSRLAGNTGMGALVAEGAGLSLSLRGAAFSNNEPFDVQNFAGVELDLSGNWWGGEAAPKVLGPAKTLPALDFPPAECP